MDFRNLCQKLDMDSIRAKLPPLPRLPVLPQIKLPKSIPKLKSRKIFRSSRENVNRNSPENQKQLQQKQTLDIPVQRLPPIPPSNFIKQTPSRISTISSLMHEESGEELTYRSSGCIDDDYVLPTYQRPIPPLSPVRAVTIGPDNKAGISSSSQVRISLAEKLHRSYKDLSEFRLKHIFAKKTVVRKDSIRVQNYVTHYEEDRVRESREQDRRDSAIAEDYTFRFKVSRQNTDHSNSITPDDSPRSDPLMGRLVGRTVGELSGDESGMETTPPPRKQGIAATRFARVRNPPLRQSSSEHEEEKITRPEPNESSLWVIQKKQQQIQSQLSDNETKIAEEHGSQTTAKKLSYKQRMRRLTGNISGQDGSDGPETHGEAANGRNKVLSKLKGFGKRSETPEGEVKRNAQNSPRSSDEEQRATEQSQDVGSPTSRAFRNFRHNFRRLQQSIKVRSQQQHAATDESGDEGAAAQKSGIASKAERLTTRLRRFHSRDVSVENLDGDEGEAKQSSTQSPIRQAITNKLESWKKSFKKRTNKPDETPGTDEEISPENERPEQKKRSDMIIRKLKQIRKTMGSKDELDATNTDGEATDGEIQKPKSRTAKFHQARQRTFKKVNDKMHQMKFFPKSQDQREAHATNDEDPQKKYQSEEEDWNESPQHEEPKVNLPPTITRRDFPSPHECSPERESFDRVAVPSFHSEINIPAARAAWTTKPILSQSMESDIDPSELPRVLIHQDNSDSFESTLIIAVTRPRVSSGPSAIITEIKSTQVEPSQQGWVPNKKVIADFMKAPPPRIGRKHSLESAPPLSGHKRKLSMDSSSNSDSDSWVPENKGSKNTSRRASQVGLVSIDEKCEAWKVRAPSDPAAKGDNQLLYKTKSIDIFEKNMLKGGVLTAFEDFDDELRNEPVQKIGTSRNFGSSERESSEDTADDDNSSRNTKISANQLKEEHGGESDCVHLSKKNNKEADRGKKNLFQYGNSRESLVANFDENNESSSNECEEDADEDEDGDYDRPPSAAPSPPPNMSPPPPPLPRRQPSVPILVRRPTETPPPLPKSKPPPLPPSVHPKQVLPPRVPERTSSMPRAPRPLVKTSSLRLVYSKQVRLSDVGKVNKLISKFEPMDGNALQRPRVIPRRILQDDSEDFSDDEEDYAAMAVKIKERYANIKIGRDTTPTPTNTPSQRTPESKASSTIPALPEVRMKRELIVPIVVTTTDEDNNIQILSQPLEMRPIDLPIDKNANNSQANSEYGSPLEYPSSLRGSLETIPALERHEANGQRFRSVDRRHARSRRSMTRDDENFYSFDSDEENSYYSISSTGSNRYIVEL